MGTVIVAAILVAVVGFIIYGMVKDKKAGKSIVRKRIANVRFTNKSGATATPEVYATDTSGVVFVYCIF